MKLRLLGIAILLIIGISYFIPIQVDGGANYSTTSSLLGIIIFYNPFILALYILIAIVLIIKKNTKRIIRK
ncbi:hypothetical protein KW787_01475 [Candidatus Pacearchaeota archaeon]|nr:hypothetical protein [Candidatus Pacearchaeota archaeon]